MACRKLNITDFFRFAETKKIITQEVTDLCFAEQKINAHFEYSPFGKITKTTGSIANRFVFRFSSEYQDTESGLVYYNYRYYSPELGRWLSRDPIGEYGGYNLYSMVKNYSINGNDYVGLCNSGDKKLIILDWALSAADPGLVSTLKATDKGFSAISTLSLALDPDPVDIGIGVVTDSATSDYIDAMVNSINENSPKYIWVYYEIQECVCCYFIPSWCSWKTIEGPRWKETEPKGTLEQTTGFASPPSNAELENAFNQMTEKLK